MEGIFGCGSMHMTRTPQNKNASAFASMASNIENKIAGFDIVHNNAQGLPRNGFISLLITLPRVGV